ncbi:hypothetical protein ACF06X_33250 [Streptomyces sp. NPDC015346]|uniref:DUF6197 family protein n=1 Tax=Streptomyces sp. NPDC015346 TaxID=3364954 RepID=UPI0036FA91D1
MQTATLLTPDALDLEAAALYDTAAWQQIVTHWATTTPEPRPRAATEATDPPTTSDRPAGEWRHLLTATVDELVTTALAQIPPAPPAERPLPGRLGATLPDRLHTWRRIGQTDLRPSVHLAYARQILTEWGWQNEPYRLRDARGARCICGALLAAHRLGYGSTSTAHRGAAWIVTELRAQGWTDLIGPWNRAPGRNADHALDLLGAAIRRASQAGE